MPKAGLEPARPMTFDFESNASAISPFGLLVELEGFEPSTPTLQV